MQDQQGGEKPLTWTNNLDIGHGVEVARLCSNPSTPPFTGLYKTLSTAIPAVRSQIRSSKGPASSPVSSEDMRSSTTTIVVPKYADTTIWSR
jgi:hypothetical protein